MKNPLLITALIIVFVSVSIAQQTSWQWVNPLPQGNILNGVWAVSQDTCIAVAEFGTIIQTHNGGKTWQVKTNVSGITENFWATQFVSGKIGWAVGEFGRIFKTSDAGDTWTIQHSPITNDLLAINFISPTTGWLAGALGAILKTTDGGTTWLAESTGTSSTLYGISFISSTTGWAVGTEGKILVTTNGGASWNSQASNTIQNLYSVQFISSSVGLAVGSFGTILKTTNGGNNWIPLSSGTSFSLYNIDFVSSLIGWAVGSYGLVLKTTNGGISWIEQYSGTYNDLFAIRLASPNSGWAVGDFGTIISTTDGGLNWSQQSSGSKNILNGIHFSSPTSGNAVGEEGTIIRTTNGGSSWILQQSGVYQTLYGVHMVSDLLGWVVGDSAVILKTINGGLTWTEQNSHSDISLYSVYFTNPTIGWAVGDFGSILATVNGGLTWKAETSNTTEAFLRVKFLNESIGWVVGTSGEIIKTTDGGLTWIPQFSPTSMTLYSIDIIDANTVYVVGDFGTVVCTTDGGTTWTEQNSGTSSGLFGVTFSSRSTGWAAGEDGTIVSTNDEGTTWIAQNSGTLHTLWDAQFLRSSSSGGVIFAAGIGGTIISSGVSPLTLRTWTGFFDSSWSSPGNWSPVGIPNKGDSVYIPATLNKPVLRDLSQQMNIEALRIASGSKLTIGSGLARLVVNGNIEIDGTLEIVDNSPIEIVAGGNFSMGINGNFIPGYSTVAFNGKGELRGSFYNLFISDITIAQTSGNVVINNNLTTLSNITLRQIDTLSILNPDPFSLQGGGIINGGTIKRAIRQSSTDQYRFESPATYLQFHQHGILPDTMLIQVHPNTLGAGLSDTLFVKRFYSITAKGGSDYLCLLSLRYDPSETNIPIENLALFRDSSDLLYNMGVTDFLDSDYTSISLDSVSKFSNWYFGKMDYIPKHPHQYSDTLIITDNGNLSDTLIFGSMPRATDGIDPSFDEVPLGPKPPIGTFDARWSIPSTQGTTIDIRDILTYTHKQNIYTCTFQPGPSGYPIRLHWNKNVFPFGTVTLQDEATQGTQFAVDMRSQNSFIITNSSINSIQIVHKAPMYYPYNTGWNMISIPLVLKYNNRKVTVFPTAISSAFGYSNMYFVADTLENGPGYWLKFRDSQLIGIDGLPLSSDTIPVKIGWNMIGSISSPVPISKILQIPSNIVHSEYYTYASSYKSIDTIKPAIACWVKCSSAGTLVLSSTATLQKQISEQEPELELNQLNTITITDKENHNQTLYFSDEAKPSKPLDKFELPPLPPDGVFDARYASNQLVELTSGNSKKFLIKIQSGAYPLNIQWQINQASTQSLEIVDAQSGKLFTRTSTGHAGSIQISDPAVTTLSLSVKAETIIPTEFTLKQNFPNPFNPSTVIEFALPYAAEVTLTIYDVLGREVKTIIDKEQYQAGVHRSEFNFNNLSYGLGYSSGVYFYRISARSEKQNYFDVKKMLLLK